MTKLAITFLENGERKYAVYNKNKTVCAPRTIHGASEHEATLFSDPEEVEEILGAFNLYEPELKVVDVNVRGTIKGALDKYTVLKEMEEEKQAVDTTSKEEACEEDNGYPLYLFSMLWHNEHPEFDGKEYDLVYDKIMLDWERFKSGEYNDYNIPLYDSIENFFAGDNEQTVIIRRIIGNPMAGSLIAFFVDSEEEFGKGTVVSYMHVGQHSPASIMFAIEDTLSTNSGDILEDELRSIDGYENINVSNDISLLGYKPKCLYCDSGKEPKHFICESCGDGMCDECYDMQKEHDFHYQDPAESAGSESEAAVLEDVFSNGYGCDVCVSKALAMNFAKEEQ